MQTLKDIRIIDREEGKLLYNALHKYLFDVLLKEKGNKDPQTLYANQVYQDLRGWMNESDE